MGSNAIFTIFFFFFLCVVEFDDKTVDLYKMS